MKKRKLFAAVLSAWILSANSCITAFAEETYSGEWGLLDWTLENHVLTISGEGKIYSSFGWHDSNIPEWDDYRDEIMEIVMEEGVTGVESYVFADYPHLRKITLPEGFTSLGVRALADNPELTEINGLENVQEFNYQCLSGTAYIEENPFIIIDNALYYVEGTSLTVPDGVTEIKSFAFGNLTGDEYIDYPGDSLETMENNCVYYEIVLPESIQKIDDYAFALCATMTGINIPDSVQSIGDYAFYQCVNLHDLTLGENLDSVGTLAFFNCKNLNRLTFLNPETELAPDAYGTVIDWDNYFEQRNNNASEVDWKEIQKRFPYVLDEVFSILALHFLDTSPYSEVKYSLSEPWDDKTKACTALQGSISGYTGSMAETFAKENDLEFIPLEESSGILGDVNQDHTVNILDVISINRVVLGKDILTPEQESLADFDQDGTITAADSLAILKYLVGIL